MGKSRRPVVREKSRFILTAQNRQIPFLGNTLISGQRPATATATVVGIKSPGQENEKDLLVVLTLIN